MRRLLDTHILTWAMETPERMGTSPRDLLDAGFLEILIMADHLLAVGRLPPLHRDRFDRLLLAQAEREGLLLITADPVVARYPGPVRHRDSF